MRALSPSLVRKVEAVPTHEENMQMPPELVHWNPERPAFKGRIGERYAPKRPLNNFGDLLGPVIARELLRRADIEPDNNQTSGRVITVGSILHFCKTGDTVWGTGRNGKIADKRHKFKALDVRAVRGPVTRAFLQGRGVDAPPIYGDPGLLVGHLWERDQLAAGHRRSDYRVLPNFHDFHEVTGRLSPRTVDPRHDLWKVIGQIAASELIVGSSLHGIIVAESLGIPARLVQPATETLHKYEDYYRGTGREKFTPAPDKTTALKWGGEPLPDYDPQPLLDAFPYDRWKH